MWWDGLGGGHVLCKFCRGLPPPAPKLVISALIDARGVFVISTKNISGSGYNHLWFHELRRIFSRQIKPPGYNCTVDNEWYSGCALEDLCLVVQFGQCGGTDSDGNPWPEDQKCCPDGFECSYTNPFYSQCIEKGSNNTDCSGPYEQCGGQGYNGTTCCVPGYECTEDAVNPQWYSGCTLIPVCTNPAYGQCGTYTSECVLVCYLAFRTVVSNDAQLVLSMQLRIPFDKQVVWIRTETHGSTTTTTAALMVSTVSTRPRTTRSASKVPRIPRRAPRRSPSTFTGQWQNRR